ncbi:hypothetical protein DUF32_14665 [Listeria monocytogenes]|nr:hypothetical protein [Listeria monocytogenes]MCV12386.1 hypothetical protein [Listeria monocytogenes]
MLCTIGFSGRNIKYAIKLFKNNWNQISHIPSGSKWKVYTVNGAKELYKINQHLGRGAETYE